MAGLIIGMDKVTETLSWSFETETLSVKSEVEIFDATSWILVHRIV